MSLKHTSIGPGCARCAGRLSNGSVNIDYRAVQRAVAPSIIELLNFPLAGVGDVIEHARAGPNGPALRDVANADLRRIIQSTLAEVDTSPLVHQARGWCA